ncbi:MAG: BamA/TamA family outer membrane protein [Bacteroidaceae bacterium]|nr:BamA/TamA family outer membrane protein [Bacteroidaceae bacterium]
MSTPRQYLRLWLPAMLAAVAMLAGCAPTRFIDADSSLLDRVSVRADNSDISTTQLAGYVRQHPNSRWFSLLKVPMAIYCISGTDSTKRINRFFQRIGEAPVTYDSLLAHRAAQAMTAATRNMGYLTATVDVVENRRKRYMHLTYDIHAGQPYTVVSLKRRIDDVRLDSIIAADTAATLIREGMLFDINLLDRERARIAELLQNNGFHRFTKNAIRFEADTTLGQRRVALTMHVPLYRAGAADSLRPHPRYRITRVNYLTDLDAAAIHRHDTLLPPIDSIITPEGRFFHRDKRHFAPSFLLSKSSIHPGDIASEANVHETYSALSSLSALLGASVTLEPSPLDSTLLDANISLVTAKRHGISAEVEGTNSAGDFGAAVSVAYQNRNIFRRSTMLGLKVRGAFEAIKGLRGYADQNYIEYGIEADINIPEFVFPFLSRSFRHTSKAQSTIALRFNSQDRPEFHRRVLTASWRYRWTGLGGRLTHRIDAIDLNYVFMPWISETFRNDYLSDDNSSRNAVLRYNYSDLFIMRWGYQLHLTNLLPTQQNTAAARDAYSLRIGVETAGNLLHAAAALFHASYDANLGAYTLFNIAYAQYVKGDVDFAKSFRIDDRNAIALHAAFGIAYPYGNSGILPYEKRYFSGGANSVRGWAVRGLGPGSFSGSDGRVDFIRQTGDMKLDLSAEWRTHLFWKLDGTIFIDAGNVWTLREYADQPGGQFRFDTFWRQIAVAYGLGFRLNFGYFILRLDGGMKAINPAVSSGRDHYPIIHPNFKRDFHLHFAVGLPF